MPLPNDKGSIDNRRRKFWTRRLGYRLWCGCRFVIDEDGVGIHFSQTCEDCRPALRPDLVLRPVMFP